MLQSLEVPLQSEVHVTSRLAVEVPLQPEEYVTSRFAVPVIPVRSNIHFHKK